MPVPAAAAMPSPAPLAAPPPDPRLLALPLEERTKVADQVKAALAGGELSPDALAKPNAPPAQAPGGSWAAALGAGLPPFLDRAGDLALQRAADKCLEELSACDAERQARLPFDDANLLSYEPFLVQLWHAFVAAPLHAAAHATPYLEAKQALVEARVLSSRQRAQLSNLQATIVAQRAAGDLDSALVSQQRLVGSFEQADELAQSGHAAAAHFRATLYGLTRALASAGTGEPPPEDDAPTDDVAAAPAAGGGGGFGVFGGLGSAAQAAAMTSAAAQQTGEPAARLHQASSALRESLLLDSQRCKNDLTRFGQRQAAAAQEVAEGPTTDVGEEVGGDNATDQAIAGLGWAAEARNAEHSRVGLAQEAEEARCSEAVALLEGQRAAVEAGIATGDKVAYLAAQEVQHRGFAQHLDADAATLLARSLQATAQADAANCRRLSLVQARETRKVGVLLVVDALGARLGQLEATQQAYGAAASLLEALACRAGWLGRAVGVRLAWLYVAVAGVEDEGLRDHLGVVMDHKANAQALYSRKALEVDHLATQLLQHDQNLQDALDRDDQSGVHRANLDKGNTLAARMRAETLANAALAENSRALDGLVRCLLRLDSRLLSPQLLAKAQQALALAQQAASLPADRAALANLVLCGGGAESIADANQVLDAAALEARFVVPASVVEAELMHNVPGCLASGSLPPDLVAQAQATAVAQADAAAAQEALASPPAAPGSIRNFLLRHLPGVPGSLVPGANPPSSTAQAAETLAAQEADAAAQEADAAALAARLQAAQEVPLAAEPAAPAAVTTLAGTTDVVAPGAAVAAAPAAVTTRAGTVDAAAPAAVEVLTPVWATAGDHIQAAVSRDGVEYGLSVEVPDGVIPGVTYISVPFELFAHQVPANPAD